MIGFLLWHISSARLSGTLINFRPFFFLQVFSVFEGSIPDQPEVIKRKIALPFPVETKQLKLIFVEASPETVVKVDLLGMTSRERYEVNPIMDEVSMKEGKKTRNLITNFPTGSISKRKSNYSIGTF